jgi:hypothetical protein
MRPFRFIRGKNLNQATQWSPYNTEWNGSTRRIWLAWTSAHNYYMDDDCKFTKKRYWFCRGRYCLSIFLRYCSTSKLLDEKLMSYFQFLFSLGYIGRRTKSFDFSQLEWNWNLHASEDSRETIFGHEVITKKRSEWNCAALEQRNYTALKCSTISKQSKKSLNWNRSNWVAGQHWRAARLTMNIDEKRSCPADHHFWKSFGQFSSLFINVRERERERKVDRSALDSPLFGSIGDWFDKISHELSCLQLALC